MENLTSNTTITNSLNSNDKITSNTNEMKQSRPIRNVKQSNVYSEYDVSYMNKIMTFNVILINIEFMNFASIISF